MRIEWTRVGGLAYMPGLQRPRVIDLEHLEAAERDALARCIAEAHFFDLPATVGAVSRGAADHQHDVVTIEQGERRHTVRLSVPVSEPALQALMQAVRAAAKRAG